MKNKKIYKTRDLGCATYLKAKKYELESIEKTGKLLTFCFGDNDSENLDKDAEGYYKGDLISACSYWTEIKFLKTIIHERGRL